MSGKTLSKAYNEGVMLNLVSVLVKRIDLSM